MLGINIDTFPTYRQLKSAGFTDVQAEVLIASFRNLNEELAKNLVTKEEFNIAVAELKVEINQIKAEIEKLHTEIAMLSKDLTIRIGYMLAGSVGLMVALTKLI
jgi:hypothetical protein